MTNLDIFMKNIWVNRRRLKTLFPIDSRIMVTGPFYRDWSFGKRDFLGEEGVVREHSAENGWVGVVLDIHIIKPFNKVIWFYPNEIKRIYGHATF